MATIDLDLARSLAIKRQREELTRLGQKLHTPVLFLKGAWSDPVLYGGHGRRRVSDLDILVHPDVFGAMCRALEGEGYRPREILTHQATLDARHERLLDPPQAGLPVDVHARLVDPFWFPVSTPDLLKRAHPYPSIDGDILSLAPEDQIIHAALHYAGHGLELDDRHLEDCRRLLAAYPIDWQTLLHRVDALGARIPMAWLARQLRAAGQALPDQVYSLSPLRRLALRAASTVANAKVSKPSRRITGAIALLSGRPWRLAPYALRYLRLRRRDLARQRHEPSTSDAGE